MLRLHFISFPFDSHHDDKKYGCSSSQLGRVMEKVRHKVPTYSIPAFKLLVWMSFSSPFFALFTLCSSSGIISVFVLSFVERSLGYCFTRWTADWENGRALATRSVREDLGAKERSIVLGIR